jgi:hypothetical protein
MPAVARSSRATRSRYLFSASTTTTTWGRVARRRGCRWLPGGLRRACWPGRPSHLDPVDGLGATLADQGAQVDAVCLAPAAARRVPRVPLPHPDPLLGPVRIDVGDSPDRDSPVGWAERSDPFGNLAVRGRCWPFTTHRALPTVTAPPSVPAGTAELIPSPGARAGWARRPRRKGTRARRPAGRRRAAAGVPTRPGAPTPGGPGRGWPGRRG